MQYTHVIVTREQKVQRPRGMFCKSLDSSFATENRFEPNGMHIPWKTCKREMLTKLGYPITHPKTCEPKVCQKKHCQAGETACSCGKDRIPHKQNMALDLDLLGMWWCSLGDIAYILLTWDLKQGLFPCQIKKDGQLAPWWADSLFGYPLFYACGHVCLVIVIGVSPHGTV